MLLLSKSLAGGASQQTGPSRHIGIPPERMMKRQDALGYLQTAFLKYDCVVKFQKEGHEWCMQML